MPTVIRKSEASASLAEKRRDLVHAVSWTVRSSTWSPPTDAYEMEEAYIVRVEVAGMRESDFEITLENGFLQISGTRPDVPERTRLPPDGDPLWAVLDCCRVARSR